jgi:hypothetical protein
MVMYKNILLVLWQGSRVGFLRAHALQSALPSPVTTLV